MQIDILKNQKKISYLERGVQAVKFVRDTLESDTIDEPRLRVYYILLSFGFELILKSRVIALSNSPDESKLNQELKNIGHDFISLFRALALKKAELTDIGLKDIIKNNIKKDYSYFVIKTIANETIQIENFNDIRYGDHHPNPGENEHKKLIKYAKLILEISEKIRTTNKTTSSV